MHIIILGAGRVGFQLAKFLIEEDRDVVLIEKDPLMARHASDLLDCLVINEKGTNLDTLKRAGIQTADYFIAVTDSDEVNMISCGIVAREFHVPMKIARVRNIEYSSDEMLRKPFFGIDYIVNPDTEVANAIITAIERGAVSDIMFFEKSGLQMRSITVTPDSPFKNRKIGEIRKTMHIDFLVAVIFRYSSYLIPSGDILLLENDKLYLIATETNFEKMFAQIGKKRERLNKIVIVGGSTIGQHVAEHFLERHRSQSSFLRRLLTRSRNINKRRINIIESDYETCKILARRFPESLILNADISDEKFSEEAHFSDADLVVATTENQELNIVNAVYAKTLGPKRAIALVNKLNYVHVASSLGVDVAVSPVGSMVNAIQKYISGENIRSVHNISGADIDVIELSVEMSSGIVGKKIRDIKLPPDSLILSLTRNGVDMVPDGEITIQRADYLIIITRKGSVQKLDKIFAA
jgi:trk system potassium uptake protein TrkA